METEIYSYDGRLLTIVDAAMGLHFILPFTPLMLPEKPKAWESLPEGHMVARWGEREFVVEIGGVPDGQYRLYDAHDCIKAEMYYLMGKLHGPSIYYHEKHQVLTKCWYVEGKKQGKCLWYYPDGSLYSMQKFLDGFLHDHQEYYYPDGTLKTILDYDMGRLLI